MTGSKSGRRGSVRLNQVAMSSSRPGAVWRREIAVAGAAGQAVGLPLGGAALQHHRQGQIRHHPPQDQHLLPILLPKQRPRRTDQRQEPADHRGHPVEMAWAGAAAEGVLQGSGGLHPGDLPLAAWVDLRQRRGKEGMGPGRRGPLGILLQGAGIAGEVLTGPELQRVDKHAEQHPGRPGGAGLGGPPHQGGMARVQGAHRGHEMQGALRVVVAPMRQLGAAAKQIHPQNGRRPSRQSGGWAGTGAAAAAL